jgi:hypothetical protein
MTTSSSVNVMNIHSLQSLYYVLSQAVLNNNHPQIIEVVRSAHVRWPEQDVLNSTYYSEKEDDGDRWWYDDCTILGWASQNKERVRADTIDLLKFLGAHVILT